MGKIYRTHANRKAESNSGGGSASCSKYADFDNTYTSTIKRRSLTEYVSFQALRVERQLARMGAKISAVVVAALGVATAAVTWVVLGIDFTAIGWVAVAICETR